MSLQPLSNTKTVPVVMDTRCSYAVTFYTKDFVSTVTYHNIGFVRSASTRLEITGYGIVKWQFCETNGNKQTLLLPCHLVTNSLYIYSHPNTTWCLTFLYSGQLILVVDCYDYTLAYLLSMPTTNSWTLIKQTSTRNHFWGQGENSYKFAQSIWPLLTRLTTRYNLLQAIGLPSLSTSKAKATSFSCKAATAPAWLSIQALTRQGWSWSQGQNHFELAVRGCLPSTRGAKSISEQYCGGTIFYDHASHYISTHC